MERSHPRPVRFDRCLRGIHELWATRLPGGRDVDSRNATRFVSRHRGTVIDEGAISALQYYRRNRKRASFT